MAETKRGPMDGVSVCLTPGDDGTLCLQTVPLAGPTQSRLADMFYVDTEMVIDRRLDRWLELFWNGKMNSLKKTLSPWLSRQLYGKMVAKVAEKLLFVREDGVNAGDDVEEILMRGGGKSGQAWCAAFAYWCHYQAAALLCGTTSCPQTLNAVSMWTTSHQVLTRVTAKSVRDGNDLPQPGDVFIMSMDSGYIRNLLTGQYDGKRKNGDPWIRGHTGIVIRYDHDEKRLITIEGNTNAQGSREGDGVYRKTNRMDSSKLVGFVRPTLEL